MILETIVALTIAATGGTCAGHDNAKNKAVWGGPYGITTTTYTDNGRIRYRRAPGRNNNAAWIALHANERALQVGAPGRKVRVSCVFPA